MGATTDRLQRAASHPREGSRELWPEHVEPAASCMGGRRGESV